MYNYIIALTKDFFNMLFSIIIPVYNNEKYIKFCLDKIINQTFQNFEVLCINDGSTDNTSEILKKYSEIDSRIKIINIPHSGVSKARNIGLEIAAADYVSFIDSDDVISINLYEKVSNIINNSSPEIIIFNGLFYDQKRRKLKNKKFIDASKIINYVDEYTTHTYKDFDNLFFSQDSIAIKIFKKSFLKENNIQFDENTCFEDVIFNFFTLLSAKSINVLDEYLYLYRQNINTSITAGIFNKKSQNIFQIFETIEKIEKFIIKYHSDFTYNFLEYMISTLIYYYKFTPYKIKSKFYYKMQNKLKLLSINPNFNLEKIDKHYLKEMNYVINNNYYTYSLFKTFMK